MSMPTDYLARLRSLGYRNRQIAKGGAATLAYRGTSVLVNLVTVPLLYEALGRERFGVVMALLAVGVAVSFGDLGVGNGLQNYLASVQDDRARAAEVVKTGLAYASGVALAIVVIAVPTVSRLDLRGLFGTDILGQDHLAGLTTLLIGLLAVQIPLSLGQRVLAAYQRLHVHGLIMASASVVSLCGVLLVVHARPSLGAVLLALLLPQVLANGAALAYAMRALDLRIGKAQVDWSRRLVDELLLTGLVFFAVQAAFIAHATTDSLFVSSSLGAGELTDYSLVMRVVAVLVLPISALAAPLLGGLNDALARGDREWVRQGLRRVAAAALANVLLVTTVFTFAIEPVLGLWIGRAFAFGTPLLLSFAAVLAFQGVSIPLSTCAMTTPLLRPAALAYCGAVAVGIGAKAYALSTAGLASFNLASATALAILYVTPTAWLTYRRLYAPNS